MIKVVTTRQLACPKFPVGTPVDENGCARDLCPYFGYCESTKPNPFDL